MPFEGFVTVLAFAMLIWRGWSCTGECNPECWPEGVRGVRLYAATGLVGSYADWLSVIL